MDADRGDAAHAAVAEGVDPLADADPISKLRISETSAKRPMRRRRLRRRCLEKRLS